MGSMAISLIFLLFVACSSSQEASDLTWREPEDELINQREDESRENEESEVNKDVVDSDVDQESEDIDTPSEEVVTPSEEVEISHTLEDFKIDGINELGQVMVIMYHGIKDQPPYHRLAEDFIKDLNYLYEHNYYLVSLRSFVDGRMDVPYGKTPVVLTFDDGLASTFSLIEDEEANLVVNQETAIGMLEAFCLEHPDFGRGGALFFHNVSWSFNGAGSDLERYQWLMDHGYEMGNHTANHAKLSQLDAAGVTKELGLVNKYLLDLFPEYDLFAITYPYGIRPKEEDRHVMWDGVYEGYNLDYEIAFREAPSRTFYAPTDIRYDYYNAPRVRGSEGAEQDLWWFFEYYEKHPEYRYYSDGDMDTIVVPIGSAENVREDLMDLVIVYE